ncbi:hypothetical protein BH09BAC5_BH09BAC5_10400 [soil metagenome]
MKSVKFAVLFGALSLVFMGCPYESKVPVDALSNSKADKQLVGKWDEKGSDDYLWVATLDGSTYTIEKRNIKDGGDPTVYKGFISDVSGSTFMNVWDKSDDADPKYYVYKMDKKGDDRVVLKAMTDNVTEEFETSTELRAFIKANMGNSYFWNKDDDKSFYRH